jgi:hypothetical protein
VPALRKRLFNKEKVVAAGMRFDEGNHDVSIVPQRSVDYLHLRLRLRSRYSI